MLQKYISLLKNGLDFIHNLFSNSNTVLDYFIAVGYELLFILVIILFLVAIMVLLAMPIIGSKWITNKICQKYYEKEFEIRENLKVIISLAHLQKIEKKKFKNCCAAYMEVEEYILKGLPEVPGVRETVCALQNLSTLSNDFSDKKKKEDSVQNKINDVFQLLNKYDFRSIWNQSCWDLVILEKKEAKTEKLVYSFVIGIWILLMIPFVLMLF